MVHYTKFEVSETALKLIRTTTQIVNGTFVANGKRNCNLYSMHCIGKFIGGAIIAINSVIDISLSRFLGSTADSGGAIIYAEQQSIINMSGNIFINTNAREVLYFNYNIIIIGASELQHTAGGVLYSNSSAISIDVSEFQYSATEVLCSFNSTITIDTYKQIYNNDRLRIYIHGGVLRSSNSNITIRESEFHHNSAFIRGVLYLLSRTITIEAVRANPYRWRLGSLGGVLLSDGNTIALKTVASPGGFQGFLETSQAPTIAYSTVQLARYSLGAIGTG